MSQEHENIAHENLEQHNSREVLEALEHAETSKEDVDTQKHAIERQNQIEEAREKLDNPAYEKPNHVESDKPVSAHHPTKLDKQAAYWDTLRSVQRHLNPVSRKFSQYIHNPIVDRTSEIASTTIARPSVLLGATSTAFLLGGFLYITARLNGFSLSGSEFIFSLIVGGLLGLLVEGTAKLFKPHKNH
ncbi:MAG: hypothetical protein ACHQUB_03095 [Candidatus Saccharimonadia bacterium]